MNKQAKYYTFVGSYDGAIKVAGRWVRAIELNRIDKSDWIRWSGPASTAILRAVRTGNPIRADFLFPGRKI